MEMLATLQEKVGICSSLALKKYITYTISVHCLLKYGDAQFIEKTR